MENVIKNIDKDQPIIRRAVFALKEGDVIISFPEGLSISSVKDLDDYLKTFMKMAKREVGLSD